MKKLFQNLPLALLAAAIALSPSFSGGHLAGGKIIEIRAEDILLVILGLAWIANFLISGRKKIEKPPLFLPIFVWLGIGFLSLLANWIFGKLSIATGYFYFLKEVEFFFLYFYVLYHIKNISSAKFLIKLWVFLGAFNAGYVIYQLIRGSRFDTGIGFRSGEYGTSAIGEWGVFPTGAFFLMIFIFLFNIFLFYFSNLNISVFKKWLLGAVTISPLIGVIGSASKTNFLGFIVALLLALFFLFLKKKNFNTILIAILILIFISSVFIFIFRSNPFIGERLSSVFNFTNLRSNYEAGRVVVMESQLEESFRSPSRSLLLPFFGFGKGYVGEAHNQYLRNFIEAGLIGSIIFFILIFAIIKKSWHGFSKSQDTLSTGLSAGLLVATLVMLFLSLATEAFIVVKPSEVYWFFAGLTIVVLSLNAKKEYVR